MQPITGFKAKNAAESPHNATYESFDARLFAQVTYTGWHAKLKTELWTLAMDSILSSTDG